MKDRPTVHPLMLISDGDHYLINIYMERGAAEARATKLNLELEDDGDEGHYFVARPQEVL